MLTKNLADALTGLTIFAAALVAILEQLGYVEASVLPKAILLVFTLVATSDLLERRAQSKLLLQQVDRIEEARFDGVCVTRPLKVAEDWHEHLATLLENAKHSVDDYVVSPRTSSLDTPARRRFYRARERAFKAKGVRFRYLTAVLDESRRQYLLDVLSSASNNSHFAVLEVAGLSAMPTFNFIIVDGIELVVGFYESPFSPGSPDSMVALRDPEMVALFLRMFEASWRASTKLTDRHGANQGAVQRLLYGSETAER